MAVPPSQRSLSRRDILKGLAMGSVAAFLAACGGPAVTVTPGSSGAGGGTGASATLPPASSGAGGSADPSAPGGASGAPGIGSASPPSTSGATPTPKIPALTLRQKIGQLLVVG